MKILFHHRIRSKDGQFVHMEELTNALKKQGHEIILVGPAAIESEPFGAEAGFVDTLKNSLPGFIYEMLEFSYSIVAFFRIRKAIKKHQPDCIYERYQLFFPVCAIIKSLYKLPLLLEVNAPLYEERERHSSISLHSLARWTQKVAWKTADIVLPVTNVLADYVRSYGITEDHIEVIQNGINPQRFSGRPTTNDAKISLGIENRLVLGFIGFMHNWHGLSNVIEILAHQTLKNVHLLFIGDGPAKKSLDELVKQEGLQSCVTFTGTIERDDVKNYISAFDIALQPDVTDYASPLKLFEYMHLGKAIVAPASNNIQEILTDGEDALLFKIGDMDAFSDTLIKLCQDQTLREKLGENAQATINNKKLTWDNNATRVVNLFEKLIVAKKN